MARPLLEARVIDESLGLQDRLCGLVVWWSELTDNTRFVFCVCCLGLQWSNNSQGKDEGFDESCISATSSPINPVCSCMGLIRAYIRKMRPCFAYASLILFIYVIILWHFIW
jgi:hypothetical protein